MSVDVAVSDGVGDSVRVGVSLAVGVADGAIVAVTLGVSVEVGIALCVAARAAAMAFCVLVADAAAC